jgi:hypothetical protein
MSLRSFLIFAWLRIDCKEMKPESPGKLMEENAPEAAVRKKQIIEHDSVPDVGNAAAEERWMAVEKPDMSTGGEWIDVDVTT